MYFVFLNPKPETATQIWVGLGLLAWRVRICGFRIWGFPKLGGTLAGFLIRARVFGVYIELPLFRETTIWGFWIGGDLV